MEQYRPRAHVGKEKSGKPSALASEKNENSEHHSLSQVSKQVCYAEINRAVRLEEVTSVR
jgi:hypothetical protein